MVGYPLNLAEMCWKLNLRTPEAIEEMYSRAQGELSTETEPPPPNPGRVEKEKELQDLLRERERCIEELKRDIHNLKNKILHYLDKSELFESELKIIRNGISDQMGETARAEAHPMIDSRAI
jgi:hypothetical protein